MKQHFSRWLWFQIILTGLVVSAGVIDFELRLNAAAVGGDLALQRLDLLYLNEPAPSLAALGVRHGRAVIVFCVGCTLPKITGAVVIGSSDRTIANQYGLVTNSNRIGPGYAVIDTQGQVRYRSFDADPASHSGEINRIVRKIK